MDIARFVGVTGHTVLLVAVAAGLWLADVASAQPTDEPATIRLHGIVRDFRARNVPRGHPDFERDKSRSSIHRR